MAAPRVAGRAAGLGARTGAGRAFAWALTDQTVDFHRQPRNGAPENSLAYSASNKARIASASGAPACALGQSDGISQPWPA
jgi:hypothetical protein